MFDHLLLLLILIGSGVVAHIFSHDDWNSFDAFGIKLAINDLVVIQARNRDERFVVQFGPFDNLTSTSSPCLINYVGNNSGDHNFIYSIVLPKQDLQDASIIYIGENDDYSNSPYPFIGHLRINTTCQIIDQHIHYFNGKSHDEFYVIGVEPMGEIAYAFTSQFAFSYNLQTHTITGIVQWPMMNFTPRAIDISNDRVAILAGLYLSTSNNWNHWVYMLNMNPSSFTVIDTWEYLPDSDSWQATTSSIDINTFTTKHIMSVSIYVNTSQVLVGIPSMNAVFWFDVTTNLSLQFSRTNGYQRGYGQSLGWSDEIGGPYPVILGNTYSFPYTWSNSIIYWFTVDEFRSTNPIMPLFPTIQYPRWVELTPKLLTIATASMNVALLDSSGQVYVIVAAPLGFYPDTSIALGSNPAFSMATPCPAGTYKYWVGIYICFLCSFGMMSGSEGSQECLPYACDETTNDFCPLGSITNDTYSDLNRLILTPTNYPESPDTTNIDDILIMNMFTFGDSSRCLVISPLFWVMMMTFLATLIVILMGILKFFRQYAKVRHTLKRIFRQADLIREGEVWMGGLASLALLVLLIFSYVFSTAFLNQYPIETASESTFSCDTTLRNAQFDTSLQSSSTTISDDEKPIFTLLDQQKLNLTIDFINTQQQCSQVSVSIYIHLNAKNLLFNCSYQRSVLSISLILDSHSVELNYNFASAQVIGGFRITLTGAQAALSNDKASYHYNVRELLFSKPFMINNHTLAYDPSVELQLTRIINKTQPLDDSSPTYYSAMWATTTIASDSKLFLTFDEYLYYGLLKPSFTISISEMSYYVMNSQKPITKRAEVIFHNLLFTTVCMELFGLGYLAIKLFLVPIFQRIQSFVEKRSNVVHPAPLPNPTDSNEISTIEKPATPAPVDLFLAKVHEKPTSRLRKKKLVRITEKRFKK